MEVGSLRKVCKADDMPPESTVRLWVADDVDGFAARYARARNVGLDALADEYIEVCATPVKARKIKTVHAQLGPGEEPESDGVEIEVTTGDAVDRSRLHADGLKWYLSKCAPKRYGDKVEVEHTVGPGIEALLQAGRKRTGGAA